MVLFLPNRWNVISGRLVELIQTSLLPVMEPVGNGFTDHLVGYIHILAAGCSASIPNADQFIRECISHGGVLLYRNRGCSMPWWLQPAVRRR